MRQLRRQRRWVVCAGVITLLACAPAASGQERNLVANGDFSQVAQGRPEHWQLAGDSAAVAQTLEVLKDRDLGAYARLVCTRCDRQSPSAHAMLAQVGVVKLVKGRAYEFSCRVRGRNLAARSVSVAISDTKAWSNCGLTSDLPLEEQWQTHRRIFRATQDVGSSSRLQIWFTEPGTLEITDVRLIEHRDADVEFTDVVAGSGGRNRVRNGSFELGEDGWSSLGQGAGWGNLSRLHGTIERSGAAHGSSFLRIPLGPERTPVLYFDYYEPVARHEGRPVAASCGWIALGTTAPFTLSCMMRASRAGTPAVLGVRSSEPAGPWRDHARTVQLTTNWQRYSMTFRPQQRYAFVYVGPGADSPQAVDIDVDAVQLEEGTAATEYQPWADVEFSMRPAERGGIFTAGQPAHLLLRAVNHGAAAATVRTRFISTDYEGAPAPLADQAFTVAAGDAAEHRVALPGEFRGFYRVNAIARAGAHVYSTVTRLAIVPRRSDADSILGINHAFVSADLIELAGKAGVSWYRDWSLKWQHIEPEQGRFRWELADVQIDRVLKQGARVLPLLPPFPSADWISEAPAGLPTRGYPANRLRQAWAPKDPRELGRFVEQAANRYKDRIRVWEFLNEPIYTDYSLPADHANRYGGKKYRPADYVALLKVAAEAMRRADPHCKVIGGIGSGPRHLTDDVIEAGILNHLDIFNLHMYPGLRAPESYAAEMDQLLKLMDAHGGRKPIWITEFSYYGADDLPRRPFIPAENSWAEQRLLTDEQQCADYTLRYFVVMLSRGVEKIFIHSGASGKVNDPDFECALFGYGGTPRKLLPAMAVLTDLLGPSPRCAGHRQLNQAIHYVAFETGKRSVLVAWTTQGRPPAVAPPPGAAWMDTMGRPMATPVSLSGSPAYLVAPAGQASELLRTLR